MILVTPWSISTGSSLWSITQCLENQWRDYHGVCFRYLWSTENEFVFYIILILMSTLMLTKWWTSNFWHPPSLRLALPSGQLVSFVHKILNNWCCLHYICCGYSWTPEDEPTDCCDSMTFPLLPAIAQNSLLNISKSNGQITMTFTGQDDVRDNVFSLWPFDDLMTLDLLMAEFYSIPQCFIIRRNSRKQSKILLGHTGIQLNHSYFTYTGRSMGTNQVFSLAPKLQRPCIASKQYQSFVLCSPCSGLSLQHVCALDVQYLTFCQRGHCWCCKVCEKHGRCQKHALRSATWP